MLGIGGEIDQMWWILPSLIPIIVVFLAFNHISNGNTGFAYLMAGVLGLPFSIVIAKYLVKNYS